MDMNDKKFNPKYITKKCSELTDEQLQAFSDLYSHNYGKWSGKDGKHKKGDLIKLGVKWYETLRNSPNMYVSYCMKQDELIGYAFFLNKQLENGERCTWVTQLLVHKFYRNRRIGTRLLRSAWGFSNYFAWGLATTNAITIKTLEAVTWRKVTPEIIEKHLVEIEQLCDEISFARKEKIKLGPNLSQIFTDFYPELEKVEKRGEDIYVVRLGVIEDGYEWLAFTFQEQPQIIFDEKRWNDLLDFSAEQLEDAYSRMEMQSQPWARHTFHEIDFVIDKVLLDKKSAILDMGCGQGRHSIELARRGYKVTGVDFSERLLKIARANARKAGLNIQFFNRDCRNLSLRGTYDLILCLYDVIGSFRTKEENLNIIQSVEKKLKPGGTCVVSVMNMELTRDIAKNKADVMSNPVILLNLKASDIMKKTGDIFDPDYFLLDDKAHLVYRKEQFELDSHLASEYIIADYRFTKDEICNAFEEKGLSIKFVSYVQAGHWQNSLSSLDPKAKEILLIAQKHK